MQRLIAKLFDRYGQTVSLDGRRLQALFQSGHSRSMQSLERVFGPLGEIPRGQYVCYFLPDAVVQAGNKLQVGAVCYRICRVEDMCFPRGKTLYKWVLCARKGGEGA